MKSNQTKIQGGATLWARSTIESDVFLWKPDKWFKIWFFLISRASHKDTKQFDRGELHTTGAQISHFTGASDDQVKKCLTWMRKTGMIDTKRSTRGTRIIIKKYGEYQSLDSYRGTKESTSEARRKHERSTTINKNEKNEKNEKKDIAPPDGDADQIVSVIEKFRMTELNTTLKYGDKTQRKAAKEMVDQFGMEAIERIIDFLASEEVTTDPYAPRVTTPYQLQKKWGLIRQYYAKLKGKQQKNQITVIE